jgi:plastocyanin
MSSRIHLLGVIVLAGGLLMGCGGGGSTAEPPATTAKSDSGGSAPAQPAATAKADGPGTITGKVSFDGEPPGRTVIRMGGDPNCKPHESIAVGKVTAGLSEVLIVGKDRGIKNVFVYVKDGLGNLVYATPTTPVVLDQSGCQYEPHVFGVQVGQPIVIKNSDPTLHNVHATPKNNEEFNAGQQPKAPTMTKTFTKPEIGLSFRCDVHGWMRAFANVVTHPFFAVTKDDGTFEIKGLPAGTYTIEAWHEKLGTQMQKVTISDSAAAAKAAFVFQPAAGGLRP